MRVEALIIWSLKEEVAGGIFYIRVVYTLAKGAPCGIYLVHFLRCHRWLGKWLGGIIDPSFNLNCQFSVYLCETLGEQEFRAFYTNLIDSLYNKMSRKEFDHRFWGGGGHSCKASQAVVLAFVWKSISSNRDAWLRLIFWSRGYPSNFLKRRIIGFPTGSANNVCLFAMADALNTISVTVHDTQGLIAPTFTLARTAHVMPSSQNSSKRYLEGLVSTCSLSHPLTGNNRHLKEIAPPKANT